MAIATVVFADIAASTVFVPGRPCKLTPSTTGNWARLWVSLAPTDSKWAAAQNEAGKRILVWEGWTAEPIIWTPDVGGVFSLRMERFSRGGSSYGGGYRGDPAGNPGTLTLESTTSRTVYVMREYRQQLGYGRGLGELVLTIHNDSILDTRPGTGVRGISSTPRVEPLSDDVIALACSRGDVPTSYMASLIGTPTAQKLWNISGTVRSLRSVIDQAYQNYINHAQNATDHNDADTANIVLADANDPVAWANDLRSTWNRHVSDDANDPEGGLTGPGTANYHNAHTTDYRCKAPAATDIPSALMVIAEVSRLLLAHKSDLTAHYANGATYNADTSPLFICHYQWLEDMASALAGEATAGTTYHTADPDMINAGFEQG